MDTKHYDVTVLSAVGDGLFFDFEFEIGGDVPEKGEKVKYRLYPLPDGRYPQKKLRYGNNESLGKQEANICEVVVFTADIPVGYVAACQVDQDNAFIGLKGRLSISKSE